MARYDKYDPLVGGFRAPLAADYDVLDLNVAIGIGLDANGALAKSAASGVVGVLILTKKRMAGDIVDVMTSGEIVEFDGTAGTVYSAAVDGVVAAGAAATTTRVGVTVEATRLIVRLGGVAV